MAIVVKPHLLKPKMITQVGGRTVNIGSGGAFKETVSAKRGKPEFEREVPAATQADLKLLFEQGHPFLEEKQVVATPKIEKLEN